MIGIERCMCGHPSCKDYWLTGIGKFVQGSGFDKDEAERIAALLNGDAAVPDLLEALNDAAVALEALLETPADEARRPHARHYAARARAAIAKAEGK